MQEVIIKENEAGQRFDKYLAKYLNEAPKSFLYKMLRKKNIILNGKKATGNEKLSVGDSVKLFLSDDTIEKFSSTAKIVRTTEKLEIIYEDQDILLINKPVGMLSQKASDSDVSVIEHLWSYLIDTKQLTEADLRSFKPSICNRLDRNTSGIIVAGKSLQGLQVMGDAFKNRTIGKYYRCLVIGNIKDASYIQGYLVKNCKTNRVTVISEKEYQQIKEKQQHLEYTPIDTEYKPIWSYNDITLLEVHLITGKTHQIRAHLASVDHPIIGDYKYGKSNVNQQFRDKYKLQSQLLHAYRLEIPDAFPLSNMAGNAYVAPLPKLFQQIVNSEKGYD